MRTLCVVEEYRVALTSEIHSLLMCHYWRETPTTRRRRGGEGKGREGKERGGGRGGGRGAMDGQGRDRQL